MRLPEAADETAEKWTFEQVYQQELGRLRRIVAGMGLRASDSRDVLQEVFLTGLRRPGSWRDKVGVGRWLIRVTVNRCILEFRRRKQFQRSALKILENRAQSNQSSTGPEQHVIRAEEMEAVRDGLRRLDGMLQGPLVLRYFCDFNATQIGEILELKPATVRSRLRQARMILANELMKKGIEP